MAEFEEIAELVEEGLDSTEEGLEDLSEEAQEEIEAEVNEARQEVSGLSKVAEGLKSFLGNLPLRKIGKFLMKNAAIAVVFWGVTAALSKAAHTNKKESKECQRKSKVLKAIISLIKMETDMGKRTLQWIKDHQNDKVKVSGLVIPLVSVIQTHLDPVSESVDKAYNIARLLQKKIDGQVQFTVPNADDIQHFLEAADAFYKAFSGLVKFISEEEMKFEKLKSFPIKQDDIGTLKIKLDDVKAMPLW